MSEHDPLIHLGFYKTASTWLQNKFFRPRNNFFVAADPFQLQSHLIDPEGFTFNADAYRESFGAERSGQCEDESGVPVITSEALSGHLLCGGYNAQVIADRLKQVHPRGKILFVVREQASLIRALYFTMIMCGLPHSIRRLLEFDQAMQRRAPSMNADFLRFHYLVEHYIQLYGRRNVLVLPFEYFQVEPLRFLERIYRYAHGSSPPEGLLEKNPVKRQVNESVPLLFINLQRWLNLFFVRTPFNYAGLFKETDTRFIRRGVRYQRFPGSTPLDGFLEQRFQQVVQSSISGKFAESNRRLQEYCELDLYSLGYDL